MKLLKESYKEYIYSLIDKNSKKTDKTLQLKIPSYVFNYKTINNLFTEVKNKYLFDSKIDLKIKISNELVKSWEDKNFNVDFVNKNNWNLGSGSFTYYRNQLATINDLKQHVLILIGADLVYDSGSLEHLINLDYNNIFVNYMKESFLTWINKFINSLDLDNGMFSNNDKDNIEKVFFAIYKNYDIKTLTDYLDIIIEKRENINFELPIYKILLKNLYLISSYSCDIPIDKDFENKFKNTIKLGEKLFFEEISQEPIITKNYIKKIDSFLNPQNKEEEDALLNLEENADSYYPSFDNSADFLNSLKCLVNCDCPENIKAKLRKCDLFYINKNIFKLRIKKPKREVSLNKEKQVEGAPFEMVLGALWDMLSYVFFEKNLSKEEIRSIEISGLSLKHNISTVQINLNSCSTDNNKYVFDKVFRPVLGGLDEYCYNLIGDMFDTWHNDDIKFFTVDLSSHESYSSYVSSPTAIPLIKFKVTVNNFSRIYRWHLKPNNDISLSYQLASEINKSIIKSYATNDFIPTFALKNYDSCFFMQNDEDFKDELDSALKSNLKDLVINLVDSEDYEDSELFQIENLSMAFKSFIKLFVEKGVYSALNSSCNRKYVTEYNNLLKELNNDNDVREIEAEMFLKAFWIINGDEFIKTGNSSNGILTIIHPAMIEEVNAKNNYIKSYFEELLENDLIYNTKIKYKYSSNKWDYCKELSLIQSPIPGFLNKNKNETSTEIKGSGLFYRIGSIRLNNIDAVLTTKFARSQDDMITEERLTNKTQESKLICQQLKNFVSIHEYAQDGISISVIIDNPIQPVLAGIISFIEGFFKGKKDISIYKENPYQISLNVISTENNEFSIYAWLDVILKYWNSKALVGTKTSIPFINSNITVSHNIINKSNGIDDFNKELNKKLDSDFTIIYSNPDSSSVRYKELEIDNKDRVRLAFPVLQKILPKLKSKKNERYKMFLNRQFEASTEYIKLIHTVTKSYLDKSNNHEIYLLKTLQYTNFSETLKVCHNNSEMVLCVGEDIDKELIKMNQDHSTILIGFGSGIGSRAELNYTLSTQVKNIDIVVNTLSSSIMQLYPNIIKQKAILIAENILKQKKKITDLSIFRALSNSDTHKHDFFAYMFTRRILNLSDRDDIVCDTLISIDSYMHWYKFEENKEHTDLIWLVVSKGTDTNNRAIYNVKMHLIECKLGLNATKNFAAKAYEQLISTEKVLSEHFHNCSRMESDSKYWWMQLYRIIVANMKLTKRIECPLELQRLSEGDFEINFEKSIFVFERIPSEDGIKLFNYQKNSDGPIIPIYEFSPEFVEEISLQDEIDIPLFDDLNVNSKEEDNKNILHDLSIYQDIISPIDFKAEFVQFDNDVENSDEKINEISFPASESKNSEIEIKNENNISLVEENNDNSIVDTTVVDLAAESVQEYQIEEDPYDNLNDLRIWLGTDINGNKKYWNFGMNYQMTNRHLFGFGATGSGKTYALLGIVSELAKHRQGSLIFDYNNGMRPNEIPKEIKKYIKPQILLQKNKLSINPFIKHGSLFDPNDPNSYMEDTTYQLASRVADIIVTQFSSMGENQKPALIELIENGINSYGDRYSLTQLGCDLENADIKRYEKLKEKLMPLIRNDPFSNSENLMNWNEVFEGNEKNQFINIYQLARLDKSIQKLIIEFCLNDLWYYANNNNFTSHQPKVLFLDEIQNLDLKDNSTLNKYLVEGRKFGLNLILATQSIAKLGGIRSGTFSSLMGSAVKLYFQPADSEAEAVSKILSINDPNKRSFKDWARELSKLKRGECFLISDSEKQLGPIKIRIPSMEERGL